MSITKETETGVLYVVGSDGQPLYYPRAVELLDEKQASLLDFYCIKVGSLFFTTDQWYDRTGITKKTIRHRLQNGWPMIEAVNTPGNSYRLAPGEDKGMGTGRPAQLYELNSERRTLREWAE